MSHQTTDDQVVALWEQFVALNPHHGDIGGEGEWLSAWQGLVFALGRPDLMPRRQFKHFAVEAIWE